MDDTILPETDSGEILFEDGEKIEIACSYPDVKSAIRALKENR